MLLGSFVELKLGSACLALPLACGKFGCFHSFLFPFTFRSMAPRLCKMPLLLLSIVGLVATHLKIKEGKIALSIQKLQNIYKHYLFHYENRVRYQHDSALDQM